MKSLRDLSDHEITEMYNMASELENVISRYSHMEDNRLFEKAKDRVDSIRTTLDVECERREKLTQY